MISSFWLVRKLALNLEPLYVQLAGRAPLQHDGGWI